jgi:hypothetical protein
LDIGQLGFVQVWNEVMEARTRQRTKLGMIQEEMRREAFTGREAMRIRA